MTAYCGEWYDERVARLYAKMQLDPDHNDHITAREYEAKVNQLESIGILREKGIDWLVAERDHLLKPLEDETGSVPGKSINLVEKAFYQLYIQPISQPGFTEGAKARRAAVDTEAAQAEANLVLEVAEEEINDHGEPVVKPRKSKSGKKRQARKHGRSNIAADAAAARAPTTTQTSSRPRPRARPRPSRRPSAAALVPAQAPAPAQRQSPRRRRRRRRRRRP